MLSPINRDFLPNYAIFFVAYLLIPHRFCLVVFPRKGYIIMLRFVKVQELNCVS